MTTFDDGPAVLDPPDVGKPPPEEEEVDDKRRRKLLILALLLALIAGFVTVSGWYLDTRKPLSQLPGLSYANLPHYQLSLYGVVQPLGVAVTASGDRVYVTQSNGPRTVEVFNRAGKKVGTLVPPAKTGEAHTPVYVAINPVTQDVYVSDRFTSKVYVYSEKGTYLREFTPKGLKAKGWTPLGLTFSRDGSLYVTDLGAPAHRVLVFAPDGTFVRALGLPQHLLFPNGLAVDKHGNVLVSDSNNGRLLVLSPKGDVLASVGRGVGEGDLGLPRGVALDDDGRLYVADTTDHMVRVFRLGSSTSSTPAYLGAFGAEGQLEGAFRFPNGVAADTRGRIYVTDRENNRVQVWSF